VREPPASEPYVDAPVLAGCSTIAHWSEEAARVRLEILSSHLPFTLASNPRFTGGASNDVWDLGESFLKVCWRADRDRLLRDAHLVQSLPREIPHALVEDFGHAENMSWVLSSRVRGVALSDLAPTITSSDARNLAREMASTLETLHQWQPNPELRQLLRERPSLRFTDPLTLWASDLVTLPTPYAIALGALAKSQPFVDHTLIDQVLERIASLADVDPFEQCADEFVVLHGDPSFGNWFVDEGRITALVDFEWTRIGPRELDLVTLIFAAQFHIGAAATFFNYLQWIEEDYRALFGSPDLERRLWLYELIFFLRGVIWWPPDEPESTLTSEHHLHTLRRLVKEPLPRS
jgi:aminoglycoside phosphotransferase (APT) family kinase protein